MPSVLDRFLRYVRYDTQSREGASTYPSTEGQLVLLGVLASELRELGAADVQIDAHGYVTATVPATSGKQQVPTIGFIAHVDTSPEMPGANVRPIVHTGYDGLDILFPDDPALVLRPADNPALAERVGDDIVTASGQTLLGADNKAGVAVIMSAVEHLLGHPEIPHGPIRVGFTPDEEVGAGTRFFDVAAFGATAAYTMDGGRRGELEYESFSADAMTVTFHGFNTHPGYAKDAMVNALRAAADFVSRLPPQASPERTAGYEGFVHPYSISGGVERAAVRLIVRDFDTGELKRRVARVSEHAHKASSASGARVEIVVEEQYRNMREVLDQHPAVVNYAREAIRRAGIEPIEKPIRGGTDGSKLSFMGLPTPNIFVGEHNFHSRREWVSVQDMEKAVDVVVNLARVWEERSS